MQVVSARGETEVELVIDKKSEANFRVIIESTFNY